MRQLKGSASSLILVIWMGVLACRVAALELPPAMTQSLKAEQFAERERAEAELLKWSQQQPEAAMDELYRQSRAADDPEVRERCHRVLLDLLNEEYLRDGVGYLGVMMNPFTEQVQVPGDAKPRHAIRLILVQPDTPAKAVGLVAGDLLLGVDEAEWQQGTTNEAVSAVIQGFKSGSKVALKVFREGKVVEIEAVLGRRPSAKDLMKLGGFGMALGPEAAEVAENASREAYFRRWLARKKEAAK